MLRPAFLICVCLSFLTVTYTSAATPQLPFEPQADRIDELAQMLGSEVLRIGPSIKDRTAWQRLSKVFGPKFSPEATRALASKPIPETPKELYLDFSRTGNRNRYQSPYLAKRARLARLVLTECIHNQGEFLPAIEQTIDAICQEPTWCVPAHDQNLDNFYQRQLTLDLYMVATGWNLAVVDQWLGDRLSSATRQQIRKQLERQIFEPFEQSVRNGKPRNFWLQITNNWNAVCLASVTGTALMTLESPERRAYYVAVAENRIENFLSGFSDQGYCTEGISYWSYGVGHYLNLAEVLRNATYNQIDWYKQPRTHTIADFPWKIQIAPTVYPSFADAPLGSQPSPLYTSLLNRRLGLPPLATPKLTDYIKKQRRIRLYEVGLLYEELIATRSEHSATPKLLPLRNEYPEAAVFIFRPSPSQTDNLAVAIKGGHNDEHHNHNDVGSYVVAINGQTPLIDPGTEVYTRRTFSRRRYESDLLNSFGHPVPRVAGQLQKTGEEATARILEKTFSDQQDTLTLGLTAAYEVESLRSLTRKFTYIRSQNPKLTITDCIAFTEPNTFETALITSSSWQQIAPQKLRIGTEEANVDITFTSDAGEVQLEATKLEAQPRGNYDPIRLGLRLKQPVREATIRISIEKSK